ncbi:MAG: cobyrinate a,c-diamide synthase [Methanobacteriota archaeon]
MISSEPEITWKIPRIVIAGIHSNCGKTTVARGLMAAMVRRGKIVQPFKVGPDFIDPSHHTRICGRVSRNLDPVMMGEKEIQETFFRSCIGADMAIIEGVMGMFDGIDGTSYGSSAHIARLLDAPVILVIPVKGMSGSVHAITEGFRKYDPDTYLAGVILNMVGSARHKELLQVGKMIDQLGFIPASDDLQISSRHLGLYMAGESEIPESLADIIEEHCDIPRLIKVAEHAPPIPALKLNEERKTAKVQVAIAYDPAFCFYYQDNLDKIRTMGGELIFFSPIADDLPDADLLYLGGGYPELHAVALETGPARSQIRIAGERGMPVYAECGGLMYLGQGLSGADSNESSARWVNLLPVEAYMENRFQALGYTIGTSEGGPSVAPRGTEIRGHEFHYSRLDPDRDASYAIKLSRGAGITAGKDGVYVHNSMGSYTHAYFLPQYVKELIRAAKSYSNHK